MDSLDSIAGRELSRREVLRALGAGFVLAASGLAVPAWAQEVAKDEPKPAAEKADPKPLDLESKTFISDLTEFGARYLNETYRGPAGLLPIPADPELSRAMERYARYLIENGQKLVEKEMGKVTNGKRNVFPWANTSKTMHVPDEEFVQDKALLSSLRETGMNIGMKFFNVTRGESIEDRVKEAFDFLSYLAPFHRPHFWVPTKEGKNGLGVAYLEGVSADNRRYGVLLLRTRKRSTSNLGRYVQMIQSGDLVIPTVVKLPQDGASVRGFANEIPNPGDNPENKYGFCPGGYIFAPVHVRGMNLDPEKTFVRYDGEDVHFTPQYRGKPDTAFAANGGFLVPIVAKPGTPVEWRMTLKVEHKPGQFEERMFEGHYTIAK